MSKAFIICPVRHADPEVTRQIELYVANLEENGRQVHWPPRDTDQSDPHGMEICLANCDAIIDADEVHIWYDPRSTGSHFDRGMLFAMLRLGLPKRVFVINPISRTSHESFENVFIALAERVEIARGDYQVSRS